jgi:hypothetical protein
MMDDFATSRAYSSWKIMMEDLNAEQRNDVVVEMMHIACEDKESAMQRAVEEETTPKNESELLTFMLVNIQRMSEDNREFFIKDLFARYPELNPLRTELERVRGYARHTDDCNIIDQHLLSQNSFTIFLAKQFKALSDKDYDDLRTTCTCGLEGGGDGE